MKTIFVATDFSAASGNAFLYATELAKTFNARIVLFNAYHQLPVPVTDTVVIVTPGDMRELTQGQLNEMIKSVNVTYPRNIETKYEEGPAAHTILKVAKDTKADLIIAGMKESGKGLRRAFGSTVTELARKTDIPLLVIPEETKFSPVKTITLANESDIEPDADEHILDTLRETAEMFHSKVYLVRIAKNEFKEAFEVLNPPYRLNRILKPFTPEYECIESKDVPGALNEFIKTNEVTMLAMLPHKHSLLERFFLKSATRSMIFDTHIPLLILPDFNRMEKSRRKSKKETAQ